VVGVPYACRALLECGLARPETINTRIDIVATLGGSDANLLAAVGLPTLCGLGPVGGAVMTAHEYIELPTLAERTAVVAALAHKLATRPGAVARRA
jgi:glutamate carboxypeptidase